MYGVVCEVEHPEGLGEVASVEMLYLLDLIAAEVELGQLVELDQLLAHGSDGVVVWVVEEVLRKSFLRLVKLDTCFIFFSWLAAE